MRLFLLVTIWLLSTVTHAHQLSTAYFQGTLNNTGILQGEWQVRLYDLEQAIGIDSNGDGELLWGELQTREGAVSDYLHSHLQIARGDTACTLLLETPWKIDRHFNEGYLVLSVRSQCALKGDLQLHYDAFFREDSEHKLLLNITTPEDDAQANHTSRIISNSQRSMSISREDGSLWITFKEFVVQGAIHIWKGFDHILFLLSLLLTCVLTRRNNHWVGKRSIRDIITSTTWIVTAFTLAHSITLTATALGWIHLPSHWVEVGIAISVAIAALNNIYPLVLRLGWLTFSFGLLHGMGFAGVLDELGLPADQQLMTVLAFNLGVEVGQLAIVALVLPVLIFIRNSLWYSRYSLVGASTIIALVAIHWTFERI